MNKSDRITEYCKIIESCVANVKFLGCDGLVRCIGMQCALGCKLCSCLREYEDTGFSPQEVRELHGALHHAKAEAKLLSNKLKDLGEENSALRRENAVLRERLRRIATGACADGQCHQSIRGDGGVPAEACRPCKDKAGDKPRRVPWEAD